MDYIKSALQSVHEGKTISCTPEEYKEIREALQNQAGRWIGQLTPA